MCEKIISVARYLGQGAGDILLAQECCLDSIVHTMYSIHVVYYVMTPLDVFAL